MHRHKEECKTWVRLEPDLDLLASMHVQVIKDKADAMDRDRNFLIQLDKQSDELLLPFPSFCLPNGPHFIPSGSSHAQKKVCSTTKH